MAFETITDEKIEALATCNKRVTNPSAKGSLKEGTKQITYQVVSIDDKNLQFIVYLRQNLRAEMEDDFSCGIKWIAPSGEQLTLRRYNGSSHDHPNHLENQRIGYNCHIHIATEKYIKAGKKPEGYAIVTTDYKTLDGALHCLVTDCNISGIDTTPDITNLISLF